ncbi:MAG: hypothetical protein ACYTFH_09150 [Planctomycetota bacterium]|jgi:hypothetical protein
MTHGTRHLAGMLTLATAVSGSASAELVIDTYPYWTGDVTNGWERSAQTFSLPDTAKVLDSFTFGFGGGPPEMLFSIVVWDVENGPVGDALFERVLAGFVGDISVADIGLALEAGVMYAAVTDYLGYDELGTHAMLGTEGNPGGNGGAWYRDGAWTFLPGYQTQFRAEFIAVPAPAAAIVLAAGRRGRRRD